MIKVPYLKFYFVNFSNLLFQLLELLKTRIKAGRITNLTDARYFAARGVHWLGFQLDAGGEGHVSPQMFSAIKEWLEGPLYIGTFGASTPEEINEAVNLLGLDMVQVGFFLDRKGLASIKGAPIIKEIVVEQTMNWTNIEQQLADDDPLVETFLLNFDKNGITWEEIQKTPQALDHLKLICNNFKIILSIVCKPIEIMKIMDTINPHGFNFVGGDEEKVGFKSFEEMDEIFDLLEIEQ